MSEICRRYVISGRVQGVWYRDATRKQARQLGITGWVKNRSDGAVEIVAEGSKENVEKLRQWCNNGPPAAIVSNIREFKEDYTGEFKFFNITF